MMRPKRKNLGLSLAEIIIAVAIGSLIVGASLGLYMVASKTFSRLRPIMTLKETAKTGLDQLGWFFSKMGIWGALCQSK